MKQVERKQVNHKPVSQRKVQAGLCIAICSLVLSACAQSRQQTTDASAQASGATAQAAASSTILVGVQQRADAFAAAKDVLRELRFELNRIDGREGVLTTQPKFSSGLATPWDAEQSSARQEVEDLVHKHSRIVRVQLVNADENHVQLEVSVALQRTQSPGQKLSPRAIALSTTTIDQTPVDARQVQELTVTHTISRDTALEQRILQSIQSKLGSSLTLEQRSR